MSHAAEFNIIKKYFTPERCREDVVVGVGDDGAVLNTPEKKDLVMSVDTLVSGIHFPESTSAADIAYKTAAVNLSDMAAMGAEPAWALLSLTLPEVNETWLQAFSESLLHMLTSYNVQLVGGDTTHGPLSISLQITGFVEKGQSMQRNAAETGDLIFVSGTLGDAALGLAMLKDSSYLISEECLQRLNRPTPRVGLGVQASHYSRCAIDISDGLLADLGHILESSRCGATICKERLPLSAAFEAHYASGHKTLDWDLPLRGGDDYELCIVAKPAEETNLMKLAKSLGVQLSCIGTIVQGNAIRLIEADGTVNEVKATGYQHFAK